MDVPGFCNKKAFASIATTDLHETAKPYFFVDS